MFEIVKLACIVIGIAFIVFGVLVLVFDDSHKMDDKLTTFIACFGGCALFLLFSFMLSDTKSKTIKQINDVETTTKEIESYLIQIEALNNYPSDNKQNVLQEAMNTYNNKIFSLKNSCDTFKCDFTPYEKYHEAYYDYETNTVKFIP